MLEKDLYTIKSVQRALAILKCFSFEEYELNLVQLSKKLNLHKSTVHRFVKTLESEGFLQKNTEKETYMLGMKIFELGRVVHETMDLRNIALPVMRELAHSADRTVFLSVVVNKQKVCIEKVEAGQGLQPSIKVGQVVPLHAGSSGKVLLAYMSEEEVEEILAGQELFAFTPNTVVSKKHLQEQMVEIRKNGYAVGFEEKVMGGAGISAPIIDHHGQVKAAISLTGPTSIIQSQQDALIPKVVDAARKISAKLGNPTHAKEGHE